MRTPSRYAGRMGDNDPRDEDLELFRQAVGPVRPVDAPPLPPAGPKPKPRARMAERDEAAAATEFRLALDEQLLGAGDVLSHRTERLPPYTFQRLKRGELSAQEEIDLHGLDARQAQSLLREFLADARRHGVGCVRIIHGKGRGADELDSSGAPVLKNLVDRVLRHRADVLGFHSAPPAQGGTGAVVVLLAKR
ncbi:DNA-nicking Smr family endonuclease [Lysobacter sp. HA18]